MIILQSVDEETKAQVVEQLALIHIIGGGRARIQA